MWLNLYGRQAVQRKINKGLKMHICQLIWAPLFVHIFDDLFLSLSTHDVLYVVWADISTTMMDATIAPSWGYDKFEYTFNTSKLTKLVYHWKMGDAN